MGAELSPADPSPATPFAQIDRVRARRLTRLQRHGGHPRITARQKGAKAFYRHSVGLASGAISAFRRVRNIPHWRFSPPLFSLAFSGAGAESFRNPKQSGLSVGPNPVPSGRAISSAELALYRMETRLDRRCLRCDKEFRAQRSSAKYCCNGCRQLAYLRRLHPPGDGGPLTWADIEAILWRPTPPVRD
jgi:hypothetical protein